MPEKTEHCESSEPVLRESPVPNPPVPEDGQMPEEPTPAPTPTPKPKEVCNRCEGSGYIQ